MNTLAETVPYMLSTDWKERQVAEYWQTKIRKDRLDAIIEQYEAGTLPYPLACPIEYLKFQSVVMHQYLFVLELRAEKEGIDYDDSNLE